MRNGTRALGMALAVLIAAGGASAAVTTITTDDGTGADALVEGNYTNDGSTYEDRSGNNYGSDGTARARHYDESGSADYERYEKIWLRFDLPDLLDTVSEADLDIFYTRPDGSDGHITLYGLNERSDDDYGTGSLGEGWAEGSIDWNNAPGNVDAIDGSAAYGLEAGYVTELFTFITTGADEGASIVANGVPEGITPAQAEQALIDFLNTDTDGVASFILIDGDGASDDAHANIFATKEFTDDGGEYTGEHAPRLDLTYTEVPEPASLTLLGLGGLAGLLRRRR